MARRRHLDPLTWEQVFLYMERPYRCPFCNAPLYTFVFTKNYVVKRCHVCRREFSEDRYDMARRVWFRERIPRTLPEQLKWHDGATMIR